MKAPKIEYYGSTSFYDLDQDGRGVFETRWFWRLRAANGKVIADGGQGFASKSNVKRAIGNAQRTMSGVRYFNVVEVDR